MHLYNDPWKRGKGVTEYTRLMADGDPVHEVTLSG